MDGLSSASNNSGQQQPTSTESTPFISNLTALTPISSQVVDDFQSDPKWEFTPLEKASLDCIEMESAQFDAGNDDQQIEQNVASLSQDRNKFETTSDSEESAQKELQHVSAEERKSHEPDGENKISHGLNNEVRGANSTEVNSQESSVLNTSKDEMDQSIVVSEEIIESTQPSEVDSIMACPVISSSDTNAPTDVNSREPDKSDPITQQSKIISAQTISTGQQKVSDLKEESYASNTATNFLSQTSVDAQMEKVIENVVELGGGQHFGQVFGRSEDKAKVLESIHREITSDRSSMEIMADIALQQLPLVTDNLAAPACTEQQTFENQGETVTKERKANSSKEECAKPTDLITGLFDFRETKEAQSNIKGTSEKAAKEQVMSEVPQIEAKPEAVVVVSEKQKLRVQEHSKASVEASNNLSSPLDFEQISTQSKATAEDKKTTRKSDHGEKFQAGKSRVEDEKHVELTRSARSMRVRAPKKLPEYDTEDTTKKQVKRSRNTVDIDHNKSFEAAKNTPRIKLPTQRSRATISTSNPSARPTPPSQKRKHSPSPDMNDSSIEKKYACSECNFSTDRLNNLVFHFTKSYCPGKCQMVEDMKADIIKQQQTPKGNKNKRLAR